MPPRKTSPARAAAARRNGATSRGPTSAAGKARVARNGLTHGLRAQKAVTLTDEDAAAFAVLGEALQDELAPVGALQHALVARLAGAVWRARRVDRLEAALLGRHLPRPTGRTLPTPRSVLAPPNRYRGAVLAELFRSLGALRVLQAGPGEVADLPAAIAAPTTPKTDQTRGTSPKQRLGVRP